MMDDIFSYIDDLPGLAAQYQDARVNIALANQQYQDVRDGNFTVAALAYHWSHMTPADKVMLLALGGLFTYAVFKD
jgi:hypothetical protein